MNDQPQAPKDEKKDLPRDTMFSKPRRETMTSRDEMKTFWEMLLTKLDNEQHRNNQRR